MKITLTIMIIAGAIYSTISSGFFAPKVNPEIYCEENFKWNTNIIELRYQYLHNKRYATVEALELYSLDDNYSEFVIKSLIEQAYSRPDASNATQFDREVRRFSSESEELCLEAFEQEGFERRPPSFVASLLARFDH